MRMIVAGGGTGGHLFPGLAVARAMTASTHADVLFVGSRYGIEAEVVPRSPFAFRALAIRGARGRGLKGAWSFVRQLPAAIADAWRILAEFRPDLVVGLGGYGSVPVVLAAWLRRVPAVVLEQNAHPGMANRLMARIAKRVCTNFSASAPFFPAAKVVQTGNPVRPLQSRFQPRPDRFTVFVFGGSQGARSINRATVGAMGILGKQIPDLELIHQTGSEDAEWVTRAYAEAGVTATVSPFVHAMGDAYGSADLVVCRAGATTLAELTALGKPAVLVPYPFAADDHQRVNAEVLVGAGAAELILDAELSGDRLAERILALARDRARLASMARAARALAVPDAAERVVAVCREVARPGKGAGAG